MGHTLEILSSAVGFVFLFPPTKVWEILSLFQPNGELLELQSWSEKRGTAVKEKLSGSSKPAAAVIKGQSRKLKYVALGTHSTGRTPAGLNQRSRLFPEEPIGARSRGWLSSAPCGREERGPPGRIRRCNSQHAVPGRHTLAFTQATFCLFLLFLSAIHANRRVEFLV